MKVTNPQSQTGTYSAFVIPLVAVLGLGGLVFLPRVSANSALAASFLAAAGGLAIWGSVLFVRMLGKRQAPGVDLVIQRQHWIQALVLLAVYLYWGWYWRPVYDYASLLAGQVLFAYGFEALLSWSRGKRAALGFEPLQVVGAMNLFLWFKDDWFAYQFAMVAVGYLGKSFLTWEREGRQTHIFNPAALGLAAASVPLIALGLSEVTWGAEMAATLFRPPNIYLIIFLLGFVVQAVSGVTSMTLAAAATVYLFGLSYAAVTGTYFFIDSAIPIAVFVGMHLLITDLSTAPTTTLGRLAFGVLYGVSVLALYALLEVLYVPSFYNVFLAVPLLNLSVKTLDGWARGFEWAKGERRGLLKGVATYHNLFEMVIWAALFALMIATGAIGDEHEGGNLAFWREACAQERFRACEVRKRFELRLCEQGSGWACNERGADLPLEEESSRQQALALFTRACELGYGAACGNKHVPSSPTLEGDIVRARPDDADWVYVLQDGTKGPLPPMNLEDLLVRACDKGWVEGCVTLGVLYTQGLDGAERDLLRAADALTRACEMGDAPSCTTMAVWYDQGGEGFMANPVRALKMMERACELGAAEACKAVDSAIEGRRGIGGPLGWDHPAATN